MSSIDQKFRQRFLKNSLKHATFHNRLTEEDSMWRRRELEREKKEDGHRRRERYRSRSPHDRRHSRHSHKNHRSPSPPAEDTTKKQRESSPAEHEFGPPLPSNLGIEADRWDHAYYMQRYPDDYSRRMESPKSKRRQSTSSDDDRDKKQRRMHEKKKSKKSKRRHRSRS